MRLFTRKRLGNQKYYYSINLSTLMVERCIETTYLESDQYNKFKIGNYFKYKWCAKTSLLLIKLVLK